MKDRDSWFRPKLFGIGSVPVTWQGWLVTAAMLIAVGLITNLSRHGHPAFLALLAPVAFAFLWISWARTEGGWHWRWGDSD
ncbi:MAG: hypothetical protein ABW023_03230 [Sphingomonas sp.]